MVQSLNVLSVSAVVAAGCILALCADEWFRPDYTAKQSAGQAGAVQRFTQSLVKTPEDGKTSSPLVAQAQAFALYLNPPAPVKETPAPEAPRPAPAVRPADPSPRFKVLGTSYLVDDPKRSMALIREPGAADNGQWVKEGVQIGHFTIHEIRPGSVVYMVGETLCEMAIEQEAASEATVAGSDQRPSPSPQTAMNGSRPPPASGQPKRPTRSSGPTVGSARTAALN